MKKWMIIFILILSIQLVLGDIISINSGGSENIVILPEKHLNGFLFGEAEIGISGGGGGITPELIAKQLGIELNLKVCNITYPYYIEGAEYYKIPEIQEKLEEINITLKWTEVRIYLDNWALLCSQILEKVKEEELVKEKNYWWIFFIVLGLFVLWELTLNKKKSIIYLRKKLKRKK